MKDASKLSRSTGILPVGKAGVSPVSELLQARRPQATQARRLCSNFTNYL